MEKYTHALPLRAAYEFGAGHQLEKEVKEIRDMPIEATRKSPSSLRRGFIVALFESRGLFDEFKKAHWPFGSTSAGEAKRRWYLRIKAEYEDSLASRDEPTEDVPELEGESRSEDSLEFVLEAHLRDFLAQNMEKIEPGLRLHCSNGTNGIEFPVDGGRIDLLAVDRGGRYVVIELKLSQGRKRTLGQILYYMGWVDQNLGNGPCRGIIISNKISDELSVAVARAPGVSLSKYRMTFSVEPVSARLEPQSGNGVQSGALAR